MSRITTPPLSSCLSIIATIIALVVDITAGLALYYIYNDNYHIAIQVTATVLYFMYNFVLIYAVLHNEQQKIINDSLQQQYDKYHTNTINTINTVDTNIQPHQTWSYMTFPDTTYHFNSNLWIKQQHNNSPADSDSKSITDEAYDPSDYNDTLQSSAPPLTIYTTS